jgi:hypothetical protein
MSDETMERRHSAFQSPRPVDLFGDLGHCRIALQRVFQSGIL